MASMQSTKNTTSDPTGHQSTGFAFAVITGLFFMWGFITSLNDVLIPYLKNQFVLSYVQATLIQFTFFGAYFIGSTIYFLSSVKYGDMIEKIGYKNCIVYGLVVSAFGCLLFYPAASYRVYALFLTALFCLGLGFTLLQIAANPYIAILGSPSGASSRLNLAQGLNSLGTTIAPLIGGYFLFKQTHTGQADVSSDTVQNMYLLFMGVFLLMAVFIGFLKLPTFKQEGGIVKDAGALKYPHLILGIIAIFTYVGGEVCIGSFMINFLKLPEIAGLSEAEGSKYVAFYWAGLMIGRFSGAISMNTDISPVRKNLLIVLIPVLSFVLIGFLTNWTTALIYGIFLILNLVASFMGNSLPDRTLGIFSLVLVALVSIAVFTTGQTAMWCLIGAGLFNSILWSNIFTLAIAGLGKYTAQGSSLLIMAILGAATVPVLQGWLADSYGLQTSFVVPILCYMYLVFYGFVGSKAKNI
jgi:MFS transporter, FHS family, L-fucose permease